MRIRLHEVQLEPWEDVVDPAGGDVDVFIDCAARSLTCCTKSALASSGGSVDTILRHDDGTDVGGDGVDWRL
jgi:hypothetical protein